MIKYSIEFPIKSSVKILFNAVSTPTGLSEWFANDVNWNGNNVLLFGSEGFGINQKTEKYVDYFVEIKMNDKIDSLNISNSAAIVFHHINKSKK